MPKKAVAATVGNGDKRMSSSMKHQGMTRNSPKERTPEEIRAGNKRIGLIMFAVAAAFFLAAVVDQYLRSRG